MSLVTHKVLPTDMLEIASRDGNEAGWTIQDFPRALELARQHALACLGGEFQFRFDDGILEMYWLNADAADRKQGETWQRYVKPQH